jgi:hypothetical protein
MYKNKLQKNLRRPARKVKKNPKKTPNKSQKLDTRQPKKILLINDHPKLLFLLREISYLLESYINRTLGSYRGLFSAFTFKFTFLVK